MVSYSKYSQVKKFRNKQNINKLEVRKTKYKKKNTTNKQKGIKTRKRKHTKKPLYLDINKKKTLRKSLQYTNLNTKLISLKGGRLFSFCNVPNWKKVSKDFNKTNADFDKVRKEQTTYITIYEKKINVQKALYSILFSIKKKIFFNKKNKNSLTNPIASINPLNSNIDNLEVAIKTIDMKIDIINEEHKQDLKDSTKKYKNFVKAKKNYKKQFDKYTGKNDNKKKSFNYKMLTIKNNIETAKLLKEENIKGFSSKNKKIFNKVKDCKKKYELAIIFYDKFMKTLSDNEQETNNIIYKIDILKKFMEDCKTEYDNKEKKFPKWEKNTDACYDILEGFVPSDVTKSETIKMPNYKALKSQLSRIYDLIKESALVTLNNNMLTEMQYVIDFSEKIDNAQKAIKKDLGQLKSDLLKYRSGEYLKTIITEIIMTHNDNIQGICVIKYHLENITNIDAVSIFTQMNTFPEIMGSSKAIGHRNLLGVNADSTSSTSSTSMIGVGSGSTTPVLQGGAFPNPKNFPLFSFEDRIENVGDIETNINININLHTLFTNIFKELKKLVNHITNRKLYNDDDYSNGYDINNPEIDNNLKNNFSMSFNTYTQKKIFKKVIDSLHSNLRNINDKKSQGIITNNIPQPNPSYKKVDGNIFVYIKNFSLSSPLIDGTIEKLQSDEKKYIDKIVIQLKSKPNKIDISNPTVLSTHTIDLNSDDIKVNILNIIKNREDIHKLINTNIDTLNDKYDSILNSNTTTINNDIITKNLRADYLYELNQKLR